VGDDNDHGEGGGARWLAGAVARGEGEGKGVYAPQARPWRVGNAPAPGNNSTVCRGGENDMWAQAREGGREWVSRVLGECGMRVGHV
jgi:hypothetical protein